MVKLFLIEYDNGLHVEHRKNIVLGVYDDLDKAVGYLLSKGFNRNEIDDLFFVRHMDFATITPIELNRPNENN